MRDSGKSLRARLSVFLCAAFVAGGTVSCGPGTNLMQIFADDDGVDSLLVRARAAYDRGSYGDAAKFAEKAMKQDGQNEHGAIILGYVSLAQGGMDSFSLIKKLISLGSSGTALVDVEEKLTGHWEVDLDLVADAITRESAGTGAQPDMELAAAGGTVTSTLDKLSDLVELTTSDIGSLSNDYTDSTSYGRTFYANYPLVQPVAVTGSLRDSIPFLSYMNRVPTWLCGFIEDSVRDADDPRDSATTCPTSPRRSGKRKGSIHLIWAFSHIAEALAFQKTLNYSTGVSATAGVSNLQGRITKYQSTNFASQPANMVDATTDLISGIDAIFPDAGTGSGVSQLSATLSAMNSASQAFAAMSSKTKDISGAISSSMTALKQTAGSISGSSENAKQTQALKGQFISTAVTALKAQIESTGNTSLCSDFQRLASSTPGITAPSGC
ncbi:hypothetical protein EBZ80_04350 [bacterium]|nr:hypothetical protein [bacterium]